MDKIMLVQGDTRPHLVLSLTDATTAEAIDLSDAHTVVQLKFRARGSADLTDTLTAYKLPGTVQEDGAVDYSNLTPGAGGRCYFKWNAGTLNGQAGDYEGEVQVTFPDGIQTVYEVLKFKLREEF